MYSLRYGTLPIAHNTGGLADTIQEWDTVTASGNGFLFQPYESIHFQGACRRALALYHHKTDLLKARREAMRAEFSWDRSAEQYEKVYAAALAA
jgi:starch synthase